MTTQVAQHDDHHASGFGAFVNTDAHATGDVTVVQNLIVLSATFDIDGTITLEAGSTLNVDGVLTAAGGCIDNGGDFSGSTGTQPCSTPLYDFTWVGGDPLGPNAWALANNWSPVGIPGTTSSVGIPATANDPLLPDKRFTKYADRPLNRDQIFLNSSNEESRTGAVNACRWFGMTTKSVKRRPSVL